MVLMTEAETPTPTFLGVVKFLRHRVGREGVNCTCGTITGTKRQLQLIYSSSDPIKPGGAIG